MKKWIPLPHFKKNLPVTESNWRSPYMNDQEVTDALIKEAYERLKNRCTCKPHIN